MNDIVDRATRSRMMSTIKTKNTKPEIALRHALHRDGYRFRLHVPNLPGTPDVVLHRYRAACFVHGCFWHHHKDCRYGTTPSTNAEFWRTKFESNNERDRLSKTQLLKDGWRVAVVWECALREDRVLETIRLLERWLKSEYSEFETTA